MSDLISRSNLIMRLCDYALQESPNDNESEGEQRISKMIYEVIQNCIACVEEQPTVYDVDKVVEELEERTDFLKDCKKYGNKNAGQQEKSYSTMMMYEVADLADDLIEIVKQGGVYDDVCEWESVSDGEFIQNPHTKRLHSNEPNMTIDEVIAHAREIAEKQRKDNDDCEYKSQYGCKGCAYYYSQPCIECAVENEQIAEWLEELKSYRASVFGGDMTQKMLKEAYNKAIDDFAEEFKRKTPMENCLIDELTEQLKAGGVNE